MIQRKQSLKKDDNSNARLQESLPISSRAPYTILHKNFRNDRKFIELYWRIGRFALDNGNVKGPFSTRLPFDNGWTADHTDWIIGDYKKFLSLLISAGHKLAPLDAAVRARYLLMIQFRSYRDEPCEKTLATKLHSTPIEGEPGHQAHRSCVPYHLKRSPSDLVHKIPLITGKSAFKFLSINLFSKLNGVTAMPNTAMSPLSDVISGTNCDLQHKVRAHRRSSSYGYQLLSLAFILIVGAQSFTAGAATFEGPISGKGGNCLTATDTNLPNGSDVSMNRCTNSTMQQWTVGSGTSQIKLKGTNKCLALRGDTLAAHSELEISDCEDSWKNHWTVNTIGDSYTEIEFINSDFSRFDEHLCLDITWGDTEEGTPVWLYQCDQSVAQRWYLAEWIGPIVGKGGKCLTVPNSDYSNGNDLYMYTCRGWPSQQWTVSKDRIRINGKCLDIENGSTRSGALVQIWNCEDVSQQIWSLTDQGEIKSAVTDETCLDVDSVESGPDNTPNKSQVWMYKCDQSKPQGWFAGRKLVRVPFTKSQVTAFNGAVKALLEDCKGLIEFKDRDTKVSVVLMKNPTPYLITRNQNGGKFTDAAAGTSVHYANRAAINGGWYQEPNTDGHQGDIWINGGKVHDNPAANTYEGFYIGWEKSGCGGRWSVGPSQRQGRPPVDGGAVPNGDFDFAIGGARPLLINGVTFDRNNDSGRAFEDYNWRIQGKPTVGIRGDLVMLMVQGNSIRNGMSLDNYRDVYQRLGFRNALLWDPNSSATLVVDSDVRVSPSDDKNGAIPVGIGFGNN